MKKDLEAKIERLKELHKKANYDILPIEIVQGDVIHRTNPSSRQVCNSSSAWGATQDNRSAHKIRGGIELLNEAKTMMDVILELEEELINAELELEHIAEDTAGEDW